MSNMTPPAGAVAERLTVNVKVVVPALPSLWETSLTLRLTVAGGVLRGFGAPAVKSRALLSVSVAPLPARRSALAFDGAGAAATPSKQLAVVPKPTKSITPVVGHEPLSAVVAETSATLPAVALIAIVPVAFGVGSGVVPPAPCASWTR